MVLFEAQNRLKGLICITDISRSIVKNRVSISGDGVCGGSEYKVTLEIL